MEVYNMWSSALSFFHLAYFLGSTMWQYKSSLHSFFWLNTIPLYGYTTFCLSMQLIDIWVVSTFWLLWIMPLQTFMHKFLCEHMFPVLSAKYLVVESLGHMVILSLTLWGTAKWNSYTFYVPQNTLLLIFFQPLNHKKSFLASRPYRNRG